MREIEFLYDVGEGGSASAPPVQVPSPQPSPSPSPQPSPQPSPSPIPVSPQVGGVPDEWTSIRDAFKPHGFDFSSYPDDHAVLAQVAASLREHQRLQSEHRSLLQQQQQWNSQRVPQAPVEKKGWQWKAPDFDPNWQHQIVTDPVTGRLVSRPGMPDGIAERYSKGQREFTDTLYGFFKDPLAAIGPGIQEMVQPLIEKMVQERLAQTQQQSYAEQFLNAHSSWLFNLDQNKQPVLDPLTSKPTLSPLGTQFYQHLKDGAELGITSPEAQQKYAMSMMRATAAQSTAAAIPAPTPEQKRDAFLQQAARQQPPAQTQPTPPSPAGMPLNQRMLNGFKAIGLNPSDSI